MKSAITFTILIFISLLSINNAFGGSEKVCLPKYKVKLKSGAEHYGVDGVLNMEGIVENTYGINRVVIARNQISTLYRINGNYGGAGAMLGAAAGAAVAVFVTMHDEGNDDVPNSENINKDNLAPLMALTTVGGGFIGFAIGSLFSKWEKIPLESSLSFNPKFTTGKLVLTLLF